MGCSPGERSHVNTARSAAILFNERVRRHTEHVNTEVFLAIEKLMFQLELVVVRRLAGAVWFTRFSGASAYRYSVIRFDLGGA